MTIQLADDRPPIPPADLILRVALPFAAENIEGERRSFDLDAIEHLRHFERALASVGRSFTDFDRLLDFGCGCGRFLRHFGPLAEEVEIHGTDIDPEMIDWLRDNVPYGRYEVAPHEPPLPYPDHHFDLVINHSVFTHIDERLQDLWLGELQRITRPGGLLLLTVEGQASWNRTCEAGARSGDDLERWRAELETRGILHISDDQYVGSTHPDFYHSTVHAPWYVFEHWNGFFDIAAYIPDGSLSQDLIVLRRRPEGSPAPSTIGRRAPSAPAPPSPQPSARSIRTRLADAAAGFEQVVRSRRRKAEPDEPDERLELEQAHDAAITRELNMLRAGLYEQGRRISVLASQLREEIDTVRRATARPSDSDGPKGSLTPRRSEELDTTDREIGP